jgi:hypothetical protein
MAAFTNIPPFQRPTKKVLEPALSELVEGSILGLPRRLSTHPTGVVMSMLASELPCRLGLGK